MNFIRKFYEADVAETGSSVETAVAEDLSPAASLAKFGQKSDENSPMTVNIPEKKEVKEKVEEVTPVAKTAETTPTEKPASEPPQETKSQVEEPPKVETPQRAAEPQKVPTLDEVLKNSQPDTILKALGYDEQTAKLVGELKDADPKLVGIIQAYKDGTLGNYVKELATDYSKMEAEDVMRHQLRVDYPKATARQLEVLYKKEVIDQYNLDSEDPDELAEGKELLAAKADRYRDSFIANQEKYLLPKQPEAKAAPVDNTAELQRQQIEAYRKELTETPYTKDIIANKKITLGEGEEKFSYPVDPNSLIDILADAGKWVEVMYDKQVGDDGKEHFIPKVEHQLAVAAFAQDSGKFLKEYAQHLKAIGAKEVIAPIDNASEPDKSTASKSEAEPTSPAGNLAKKGVRNTGGYN